MTKSNSKSKSLTQLWCWLCSVALMMGLWTTDVNAQAAYSNNFNANATGWTGTITRTTATTACGSASMRRNMYSSVTTGNMVSPSCGTSNGALATLSYNYKVANWSANTVGTSNPWGSFNVQYGATAAGPWTTFQTINSGNHIVSGTCSLVTVTFTPPAGALFIKWDAFWSAGDYYINFDDVTVSQSAGSPCVGTPAPGNTISTANPVCSGASFTLSLQNLTSGSGVTYQWQSSPDNATWANIVGATLSTRAQTQLVATYYRCEVICSTGPNTGYSNSLQVTMNTSACECLAYCASVAASAADEEILNVTVGTMNNSSTCLVVAPGPGSILARYANYRGFVAPATITGGSSVAYSIGIGTCGGNYSSGTAIFIDYNQDGDFLDATEKVYGTPGTTLGAHTVSGSFIVDPLATPGLTAMRVINDENSPGTAITGCFAPDYGETEDYCIIIAAPVACSGTPSPGNTVASASSICAGGSVNLSLQNATIGTGVTYQWQDSPDGSTWTNIGGATAATYTAFPSFFDVFYQCEVTCSSGPSIGTSNPVQITQTAAIQCYCRGTYTNYTCDIGSQDFVTNVVLNTLSNNTGTSCPSTGNGGGSPYQNWTFFGNTTTLNKGMSYTANIGVGSGGGQGVGIWIDYNQDGDLLDAGEFIGTTTLIPASTTGNLIVSVPASALLGNTLMRVKTIWNLNPMTQAMACQAGSGYGEQEDYEITIDCDASSTAPTAITTDDSNNEICTGGSIMLTQSGGTLGTLATYQWYSGSCGGTAEGSGATITVSPGSTTTYYARKESCAGSNTNCFSVTIVVTPAAPTAFVQMPIAGIPAYACNGTSANLSVPSVALATLYTWDGPTGTTFDGNPSPYVTSNPTAVTLFGPPNGSGYLISVQASNACGSSLKRGTWVRGSVSVPAAISPTTPGLVTYCASTGPVNFSCPAVTGATSYLWSITGDATVTGTGTTGTVNFGPAWNGGTLCVAAQTTCYTSPTKCLALTTSISPAVMPVLTGLASACPGATQSYSANGGLGANPNGYSWTLPANTSGSSTSSLINVTFLAGFTSGTISVTASSICGVVSAPRTKSVSTGAPTTPAFINGPANGVCGQNATYTTQVIGGASYNWTLPTGATTGGSITSSISATMPGSPYPASPNNQVCVSATNACGTSALRCITTKGAPNTPGVITPTPATWCAPTPGIEFVADVSGLAGSYTLNWVVIPAANATYVIGQGSNDIFYDWNTAGPASVNLTSSNACGTATRALGVNPPSCRIMGTGSSSTTVSKTVDALVVYPNPATSTINVDFNASSEENVQISIMDLSGRMILSNTVGAVEGYNNSKLDLSNVAKGIYMLNVNTTDGSSQFKIVVE